MNKIKSLAYEKPVLFSIVVIMLAAVLTEIPLKSGFPEFQDQQSLEYLFGTLEQTLVGIGLIVLLHYLGLFDQVGFNSPVKWKSVWLGWPMLIMAAINALPLLEGNLVIDTSKPIHIILYTLLFLSTGFLEETLFRGTVLFIMLRKWGNTRMGIYLTVIGSNMLFGFTHLVNLFQHRYTLLASLTQICFAMFFGVFFAACMLRNKSIWPVIILHMLVNFCGNLEEISVGGGISTAPYSVTLGDALSSLLVTFPLLLYGLFLLRKEKPQPLHAEGIIIGQSTI